MSSNLRLVTVTVPAGRAEESGTQSRQDSGETFKVHYDK